MAVWKKKRYQPEQIVQKIEEYRVSGRKGFPFFDKEIQTLLLSMIEFDHKLPEVEKRRIVSNALQQLLGGTEVTVTNLLGAIGKLEHDFLQQPTKPYVLATALSVKSNALLPRKSIEGAVLTFTRNLPAEFRRARQSFAEQEKHLRIPSLPMEYQAVRVHVHARSPAEAAQFALDKVDLLRAIWNLHLQYGQTRITSGRRDDPVNQIVLGPLHSLHHPSGKLATEIFWYEPGYRFPPHPLSLGNERDKLFTFETQIRNCLKQLNYRSTMEQALLRYVRALDEHDWQKSFSRLWSLLELLTHTQYANYDVTIQRACFLFEERDYYRQVLEHLRENRNRSTHDDEGSSEIEALMYQLKNIIDVLLWRQITNPLKFESMAEWGEFLDMPVDANALNNKLIGLKNDITKLNRTMNLVQKAIRFRHTNNSTNDS